VDRRDPPPLPLGGVTGPVVYYAFARRRRAGLSDGREIAAPWARIERRKELVLVPLAATLVPIGTEGVRPMTPSEFVAVARDPAAAMLVRRRYCYFLLAPKILARHPAFAAFLA